MDGHRGKNKGVEVIEKRQSSNGTFEKPKRNGEWHGGRKALQLGKANWGKEEKVKRGDVGFWGDGKGQATGHAHRGGPGKKKPLQKH